MSSNNCPFDIPYPAIDIAGKNPYYAQLLKVSYAGESGELTAITQYLYQHFLMHEEHKELSEKLFYIAQAEMRHYSILGKLITDLGGSPTLRTVNLARSEYWCGYNINNTKEITKFLEENIMMEKVAISMYKSQIELICDENIVSILKRIILDEESHLRIFEELLEQYTLAELSPTSQ